MRNAVSDLPVPVAVYGCSVAGCIEERSWRAGELAWFTGRDEKRDGEGVVIEDATPAGWYCPPCCEDLEIQCDGPKLSTVLQARKAEASPMADDDDLVARLNEAGWELASRAGALHEVARRLLGHVAGKEVLRPHARRGRSAEQDAEKVAAGIALQERAAPETLQRVTLSPALATRIALELHDISMLLGQAEARQGHKRR